MARNYSITFKSLRAGTDYVLNIGGGTGSAVPLKGGSSPFETQEDDDDDFFAPIRTQTGYIRIVDDGLDANGNSWDWKDLIPDTDLSRPVTLTAGGAVVWQGFMQAQNFSGTLYGNPQEREFPVQCALSALSACDVDGTIRELKNFAYLLYQAFANVTSAGLTINRYIFQGGATARSWLMKLIDWQNLIMTSDDGISSKYDNQRAIQDVCQFWGWSCRCNGGDIIFSCADDRANFPDALILTRTQLYTLTTGVPDGTTGTFLSSITMSGDIFAGVSNDDLRVRGFSRAMVTADGNPADKSVIGFAPNSVEKQMKNLSSYNETDGDKIIYYTADLTSFTSDYITGSCRSSYATFNIADVRENRSATSGNTGDVIRIKKSYTSDSATAYAQMQTIFHHSYYDIGSVAFYNDGGFALKGEIWRKGTKLEEQDDNGVGVKTMKMRLGIGVDRDHAWWYDGANWSSHISAFTVAVGNTSGTFFVKDTSGLVYTYIRSRIQTNVKKLTGKLFVEFLGSDDIDETDGQRSFDIKDFSIEFMRTTTDKVESYGISIASGSVFAGARKYRTMERADSREYTARNTNKARNEWNFDNIYASDNDMENGYGVVLNDDGTQMGKQTYGLYSKFPEQHLCDRVVAYWATAKRELKLELRTDQISNVTPCNTVGFNDISTFGSTSFYPIAISHSWRDDITYLTLLQL